jgi:hypothetical protein
MRDASNPRPPIGGDPKRRSRMAVADQVVTDRYALYCGDCMEVMPTLPEESVHLSVYSPPFAGLYHYSSSERDLSNCQDYEEFLEHYGFVVRELARLTMPGRMTAVHCMDMPTATGQGERHLIDFPGDIIRLHERHGFATSAATASGRSRWGPQPDDGQGLAHKHDRRGLLALRPSPAADYLLIFRRRARTRSRSPTRAA